MSFAHARRWILTTSLVSCALVFSFFMLAPALGYPLSFKESLRLMQVVFPIFLGYCGQAAYFLFGGPQTPSKPLPQPGLFNLLLKGPLVVFLLSLGLLCFVFGWVNRPGQPIGSGMTPDQFASALAVLLGFLAATTNAVVAFLFGKEAK